MSNPSAHDDKDFGIDAMIEASSLGSTGARSLRKRTSDADLDRLRLEKAARGLDDVSIHDDSALLALGDLASTRSDYSTAREYYTRAAAEQDHPNIAALTRLGELAASQGDYSTAREYYTRAAAEQDHPNNAALTRLGELAASQGDYSTAREYYTRAAAEQDHPNIAIFTRLGELAASQEDFAEAEHWLRRAAELSLMNLAEAARRKGDQDASKQWIARAKTIYSR